MRRIWAPGLGWLLLGLVAKPATAQRASDGPTTSLQEPRPDPILPAVLAPFAIGPEMCRRGHVPLITLGVFNVFTKQVAVMTLRDRQSVVLDSVPLRCGQYIARWDGTINGGTRVAPPGIYYLQLKVDSLYVDRATQKLVVSAP